MPTAHDPFAPHGPAGPPAARSAPQTPALPTGRMRRLGATQRTVRACQEAWEQTGPDGRARWAERWAVETDGGLDEALASIDRLWGAKMPAVTDWVGAQTDRAWATAVALRVEDDRPQGPRSQLIAQLDEAGR